MGRNLGGRVGKASDSGSEERRFDSGWGRLWYRPSAVSKSTPVGATGVPEGSEVDSVSQQLPSPAGEHEPQLGATRSCLASSQFPGVKRKGKNSEKNHAETSNATGLANRKAPSSKEQTASN